MMPNDSFLFINKDLSSKSLSNNFDEGLLGPDRIHKHVQRLSARQRRQQAALIDTNARSLLGWHRTHQPASIPGNKIEIVKEQKAGPEELSRPSGSTDDGKVSISRRPAKIRVQKRQNPSKHNIVPTIDSLPDAVVRLTVKEHQILDYYLKDWMPSDKHIPPDCQVAGFTPIWPDDPVTSTVIMKGALQTRSPVSIWSLLAATARRMQSAHRFTLPELYSYRAINSLRIRLGELEHIDERLILDIAYLIHFDFHTDIRTRTDLYWMMSRHLIVRLGGIQKLHPFTARISAAYDYVAALYSFTMPKMDPFRDVALVGFDPQSATPDTQIEVEKAVSQLEPRLRHEIHIHHDLYNLYECIKLLPDPAPRLFKEFIACNVHTIYSIMAGPFQRIQSAARPDGDASITLLLADELHAQTRGIMNHVWMWYSALSFLGYHRKSITEADAWAEAHSRYRAPKHVINPSVHQKWRSLDRVQAMLEGSEWQIPDDRLLWFYSIGYLLARTHEEREPYRERIVTQTQKMCIKTESDLGAAIEIHMPLDTIAPTWSQMLGALFVKAEDTG